MYLGKLMEVAPAEELYSQADPPLHLGAAGGDPDPGPEGEPRARPSVRDRRAAQPDQPAVRLPLPHPLPASHRDLPHGRAAADRVRQRPSGGLPPPSARHRGRDRRRHPVSVQPAQRGRCHAGRRLSGVRPRNAVRGPSRKGSAGPDRLRTPDVQTAGLSPCCSHVDSIKRSRACTSNISAALSPPPGRTTSSDSPRGNHAPRSLHTADRGSPGDGASGDTSVMRSQAHQQSLRRSGRRAGGARVALREAAARRPVLVLLGGDSGVGKTRLVGEFEQRLSRRGRARPARAKASSRATPSFPTRLCWGRCGPLVRERHPALDQLSQAAGRSWRRCCPGSKTAGRRLERHDRERAAAAVRGAAGAAGPAQRAAAAGADPRGHALGRPLDADVRRLPRPEPAPGARDAAAHLPHATSCTAAIRCARCCPSSSAWNARAGSTWSRSTAPS